MGDMIRCPRCQTHHYRNDPCPDDEPRDVTDWRRRCHDAELALKEAREQLEKIVCTVGEDRGVVLLSQEAPTQYSEKLKCHVYTHLNFSPLGDALIKLWDSIRLK